jgi:large subunit ribosomal protein L7e
MTQLGLKEVNNCVFLRSDAETVKMLTVIKHYVAYGYPTKQVVKDLMKKRGYIVNKDNKRVPISNNILIEEILGEHSIICVEDVIDTLCKADDAAAFADVKKALWPIQLAPLKEMSDKANTKHEATGATI